MRFYVAAKFENYRSVQEMVKYLESLGHVCTCNWAHNPREFDAGGNLVRNARFMSKHDQQQMALDDFNGARNADFLVLIGAENMCGALIEVGIAMASRSIIHVIHPVRWTIFWEMENVFFYDNVQAFVEHITPT